MNQEEALYGEPMIGWRFWMIEGLRLISGSPIVTWEPGVPLRAVHQPREFLSFDEGYRLCSDSPCEHHIPHEAPGCGIYACKTPADVRAHFRGPHGLYGTVIGRVYLWGRIFEHEHGYRAQYAYPAAFVDGHQLYGTLDELAREYNVPLDKENEAWKSVNRYAELSQNQSSYQNPYKLRPVQRLLAQSSLLRPPVYLQPFPPVSQLPNINPPSGSLVPLFDDGKDDSDQKVKGVTVQSIIKDDGKGLTTKALIDAFKTLLKEDKQ